RALGQRQRLLLRLLHRGSRPDDRRRRPHPPRRRRGRRRRHLAGRQDQPTQEGHGCHGRRTRQRRRLRAEHRPHAPASARWRRTRPRRVVLTGAPCAGGPLAARRAPAEHRKIGSLPGTSMPQTSRHSGARILLTSVLALLSLLAVQACAPSVRTTKARRSAIEQHLVVSGRVRVPMRIQIAAQVSGLVVAVGARAAERVEEGALLVQINDAELRAAAAQAKAAVDQARARVDQLKRVGRIVASQTLSEAETNLEAAEAELARTTTLFEKGAATQVDLDNARRAVERARAQRTAAEAQQIASSEMGADSRLALTALLEAQAQLAGAEARLAQTRIVAGQKG